MYISIKHLDRKYLQPNDMKIPEFLPITLFFKSIVEMSKDFEAHFKGGKQFLVKASLAVKKSNRKANFKHKQNVFKPKVKT